jgi:hypothetical protein
MEKNTQSIENLPTAQSNTQRTEHNSIHDSSHPSLKGTCIRIHIELPNPGRLERNKICPSSALSFSVLCAESL